MITYDRNRNPITNGSQVMINGTGKTGKIVAIHANGLTPAQLRRNKTVEVEGAEGKFEPVELIRLGLHKDCVSCGDHPPEPQGMPQTPGRRRRATRLPALCAMARFSLIHPPVGHCNDVIETMVLMGIVFNAAP